MDRMTLAGFPATNTGRDVFDHDAAEAEAEAEADDGVGADGDAGPDEDSGGEPRVGAEGDRLGPLPTLAAGVVVLHGVSRGQLLCPRPDKHVVADLDGGVVHEQTVIVDLSVDFVGAARVGDWLEGQSPR